MPTRRTTLAASAAGLAITLSACGSSAGSNKTSTPSTAPAGSGAPATTAAGSSSTPVVVGSANFAENQILADIYAKALQDKGVQATTKLSIGSREIYYKLLQSGTITVFPEYNGSLLTYLDKTATAASTDEVNTALASKLDPSLQALQSSQAQDSDAVVVTQAFATQHNLTSIADLSSIAGQVTYGGPPELATRAEGIPGLQKVYGLNFKAFKPLDESGPLTIAALKDGTVQAADLFTTDPSIKTDGFVALADPKHLFPAQNVTPIVAKSVVTPTVTATLNAVSSKLTTALLTQLVDAVQNQHVNAQTAADQFVIQAGL